MPFTSVNLARLPSPNIIAQPAFETILAELKSQLVATLPEIAEALELESEPALKVLEAWAYRELVLRAEIDDTGRGLMLAFATGPQLDHMAALFGVERAIVQAADDNAVPPVPEILEADDRLRERVQLALEGFSVAGPRGGYIAHAMSASALVLDVSVHSPSPGDVVVSVLGAAADGTPTDYVLELVREAVNDERVRPLTDRVSVVGATIKKFDLEAVISLYDGPDQSVVLAAAQAAVRAYVDRERRLGVSITRAGIIAALYQTGVQNVQLVRPAADIETSASEATYCRSIDVTVRGA